MLKWKAYSSKRSTQIFEYEKNADCILNKKIKNTTQPFKAKSKTLCLPYVINNI